MNLGRGVGLYGTRILCPILHSIRPRMPFVTVNDRSLYYFLRGPAASKEALTLVFIHGLGSSSSFYATIIPYLVEAGFTCLSIDTHGSGLSAYTGQQTSVKSIAHDVAAVLSSLDISPDQTVAVGHSMGGMVVGELASKLPLGGAVLIGPVEPSPQAAEVFSKRIEAVQKNGMEIMADTIPAAATGSTSTPTHRAFIRALLLAQDPKGYASLCRAIADAERPPYSRATCPVLAIVGEEDKTAPAEGVRNILQSWNGPRDITSLPGVGHWHCIEAAEEVGSIVLEFAGQVLGFKGK